MNLVLVVLEKNIKNVAENYEIISNNITIKIANEVNSNFFEYKILITSFCGAFKELVSLVFIANPLFLPIFKNFFFLLLKISSPDIDSKSLKLLIKDYAAKLQSMYFILSNNHTVWKPNNCIGWKIDLLKKILPKALN